MSDEKETGGLKRFGLRNRKTRLTSGPLFPQDDSPLPPDEELIADTSAILGTEIAEELPEPERFPPLAPGLPEDQNAKAAPSTAASARTRKPRPKSRSTRPQWRRGGDWRHNLIALVFLVASVGLFALFSLIWNDPWTPLNPLAPPTNFYFVTETPDPFASVNATATAAAASPTPIEPISSLEGLPFAIVDSGVVYVQNSNSSGCNWASIGGTVTGLNGEALNGYRIRIIDAENPERLNVEVFSGAMAAFGEGGFEFTLGSSPRVGRFDVQLFSPVGAPLSDAYRIITRDTCEQNVAVVNFVQINPM